MKRLLFFMVMLSGMAIFLSACNSGVKDNTDDVTDDRGMDNDVDSMMPNIETYRVSEPEKVNTRSETATTAEEKSTSKKDRNKQKEGNANVTKKTDDSQTKEVIF
jgi:hypothetical protein